MTDGGDWWISSCDRLNHALCNWSGVEYLTWLDSFIMPEPVFLYTLRYIVGFGLDEMVIPTNPKATMYRNVYENTDPKNLRR